MAEPVVKVRSEDELGHKLDRCFADTILKVGGGLALGVVFSVVLFKRRAWPVWFGTGVGLGMGCSNCQHDIQHPYLLHGKKIKASSLAGQESAKTDYLIVVDKGSTSSSQAAAEK